MHDICDTFFNCVSIDVLFKELFYLQLHTLEKNGKQITKMVSYCAYHRYELPISKYSIWKHMRIKEIKTLEEMWKSFIFQ